MTKHRAGSVVDSKDPILFGAAQTSGIVAAELLEGDGVDSIVLFIRDGVAIRRETAAFEPFIIAARGVLDGCPGDPRLESLGGGAPLNTLAVFPNWAAFQKARQHLSRSTSHGGRSPDAPYLALNDAVHQYLMCSGRTSFLGMRFEELRRMQVDIECFTTDGYEFCNAKRAGDSIIAIAMGDQTGWVEVLSALEMDEKTLLERFVERVRERDPDVIEGHNIFNFDLPYIAERARRHKVKLALGRDGSEPSVRSSQFSAAERTLAYERFDVFGRHVVDTLFLVHAYDVSHRSLDGFGLKEVAIHFGLAPKDRVYIEGSRISEEFKEHPERLMKYVRDDVDETRGVSTLLSQSNFVQAQMLPYSYQNVCVRGNATKIDALMVREYLRQRRALPLPGGSREFEGGYTDVFVQGVVKNVHHCDIRSLYPSLMLAHRLGPASDALGIFLLMLDNLRAFRLGAKEKMKGAATTADRTYYDALQATFKVLINSFYGYLGFPQARFGDFTAAEKVTAGGRKLLSGMIDWLREHGAHPVEIDTDGIYFVPPACRNAGELEAFRDGLAKSLENGIEVEFDGEYVSMFSYKMKNYALLDSSGEMLIKGAALKSRGLEPFQRSFMREFIRMKLEGKDAGIPSLRDRYEKGIRNREWPVRELAKTETLQDSPAVYQAKMAKEKRARSAAYELAIASGREYRAGDQVSYYVTGDRKTVAVHEKAKMVSEWDPDRRDENVAYYLAKFDGLCEKFPELSRQEQLALL